MPETEDAITCANVRKTYDGEPPVTALHDLSLAIRNNQFFTLLGPSGCGKTTLLRLIAGFEIVSGGEIHLFGKSISGIPPERRPVNTVFQNYALFPHMSVLANIRYGLDRKSISRSEANRRAAQMLDLVQLGDFADRKPAQLSGGQQQRVALARALAPEPKVLLLDEPLSALDLKLRQSMREELKRLQRETAITFIFVTHDQEEALAMSDRIAVMAAGRIQQVGTPAEIYDAPANRFVADFIGDVNFLDATCDRTMGDEALYVLPGGQRLAGPATVKAGTRVTLAIRPERVKLAHEGGDNLLTGQVERVTFLGDRSDAHLRLDCGQRITLRIPTGNSEPTMPGTPASVLVPTSAIRVVEMP